LPSEDRIRTAEIVASLSLATDLGMGFPLEHGLKATLATMRLCDVLGVDPETARQTYYASLLMYSGCTTDADVHARLFPKGLTAKHTHRQFGSSFESLVGVIAALSSEENPPYRRLYDIARRLPAAARFQSSHFAAMCEVATMLAERLGLPPEIQNLFPLLTERWDGKSVLRRAKGEEVPLPLRIIHVGRDASYQRLAGDVDHVVEVVRRRGGHAFDPDIANAFVENAGEILASAETAGSAWDATLAAEPEPWLELAGEKVDTAIAAVGAFGDLSSTYMSGHAPAVAALAAEAARLCGLGDDEVIAIRRSGHLHDVGKVSVAPVIWEKSEPLSADEWEHVRLSPYYTERIFANSPFLRPLAATASAHHERLDGSGYHRGLSGAALSPAARLLEAADAYRSKVEPRPYRKAKSPGEASASIVRKAEEGKLDKAMVSAVVTASGQVAPQLGRPAGLTEREAEVIGLLARGLQTKQIAHELGVSIKTADHHIQNAYRKIGVSTRAAAALFAAEQGLIK
jgi:HD-GYP domain-containing protein (c-di-GMP phosphodiesterase class II)